MQILIYVFILPCQLQNILNITAFHECPMGHFKIVCDKGPCFIVWRCPAYIIRHLHPWAVPSNSQEHGPITAITQIIPICFQNAPWEPNRLRAVGRFSG